MIEPQNGLLRCLNCGAEFISEKHAGYKNAVELLSFVERITLKKQYPVKIKIPDAFKWEVWERDNFTCKICGSRKRLSVDHIIPESKGGELTMKNAQTLCRSCNSRKGAR